MIQLLVDKGAKLDVSNKKGWMPVTAADGVEYTPGRPQTLSRGRRASAKADALNAGVGGLPEGPAQPPSARAAAAQSGTPPRGRSRTASSPQAQAERGHDQLQAGVRLVPHGGSARRTRRACARGPPFSERWTGLSLDDMLQVISRSMPQEAPDSLGTPAYVDIISYLLRVNGSPAGATELPLEREN